MRRDGWGTERDRCAKKEQKEEILEAYNSATEMRNAMGGLIIRPDMAEKRISEPEDISIQSSKTEKQRQQGLKNKKRTKYLRSLGQLQKVYHTWNEISEGEERKSHSI